MTVQTLAILVLLVSFFVMIFLRFPIAYAVGLSSVFCMMVQGQALTDVCRLMVTAKRRQPLPMQKLAPFAGFCGRPQIG